VARGLGEALSLPVIRLLDGSAGLFERLTADKTSLAIYTADEIYGIAASCTNKG